MNWTGKHTRVHFTVVTSYGSYVTFFGLKGKNKLHECTQTFGLLLLLFSLMAVGIHKCCITVIYRKALCLPCICEFCVTYTAQETSYKRIHTNEVEIHTFVARCRDTDTDHSELRNLIFVCECL